MSVTQDAVTNEVEEDMQASKRWDKYAISLREYPCKTSLTPGQNFSIVASK